MSSDIPRGPWEPVTRSQWPIIARAIAALTGDAEVGRHTGKALVAARLAEEYGFTDLDGKTPRPLGMGDV